MHCNFDSTTDLIVGGQIIPRKLTHKHLGVTLDENLTFNSHCRELTNKIQKLINPLRHLSKYMNSKHLLTIYNSFILPHFDYADIIYSSTSALNIQALEKLQYQAALAITGAIRGSNKSKVFSALNWIPLSVRRKHHSLIYTYKVLNNINNLSNKKYFNFYKRDLVRNNLRNVVEFSIPTSYPTSFRKTTIVAGIEMWNNLNSSRRKKKIVCFR